MRQNEPVTKQQQALLHVAKKELQLADEDYQSVLLLYGGVESSKYMTQEGFKRVMNHFEWLGFTSTAAARPYKAPRRDPAGIPYPAQLQMIQSLFDQLGWPEGERQRGFCQRVIKKSWPQTRNEANKILEGLKAILARQKKLQ